MAASTALLESQTSSSPSTNMDNLISLKEICELLKISKSAGHRMVAQHDFPAPFSINSRLKRWDRIEVERWAMGHTILGRIGVPEDVAKMAEFIIERDYATGAVYLIDGGMSLVNKD
jgi:predicted DNA-binding transcriptional regulator AlpA